MYKHDNTNHKTDKRNTKCKIPAKQAKIDMQYALRNGLESKDSL